MVKLTSVPLAGSGHQSSFSRVSSIYPPPNEKQYMNSSPNTRIVIFATGVLSIPSVMYDLGALPGAINVLGWCVINTYGALILGAFRNKHPGCHSIADMAHVVGGPIVRELVGLMFIVTYVITAASGIIGVSAALNALSIHATCTIWWNLISTVAIAGLASVRKFAHIGWLTWVGFGSVYVAVFIIVLVPSSSLPSSHRGTDQV